MVMSPAAPDFFVAIFGADAGARAIELRGRQRRQPGSKAAQTGSTACSRSDICGWRSGVLYPLAGGDRESGAAHLDLQTDPQQHACGRTMVMSPAAPDFFVAIFGADAGARAIELRGRQRRQPGSKAAQTGSTACSRSDICGWRSGVLYPLAGGDRESGAAQ